MVGAIPNSENQKREKEDERKDEELIFTIQLHARSIQELA